MEYQFSRTILGQPMASCELECEAFGDWLTNDIGTDHQQLSQLLSAIKQLQNKELNHYQHLGKEYHLELDAEEVELFFNHGDISQGEFTEHTSDPQQAAAGCGLVDFQRLLTAWQDYLTVKN